MRFLWITGLWWWMTAAFAKPPQLHELRVLINGAMHTFQDGDTVTVFKSDVIRIDAARLNNDKSPGLVNLVGFRRSSEGNPIDDRNKSISIGRDLNPKWSREGKGEVYRISISSQNRLQGKLFLVVQEAKLDAIELSINDTLQIFKPGETIPMRPSDSFKLKHVEANFDIKDRLFRFEVRSPQQSPVLVFERNGRKLATFPIQLR